jgi:hypothetical protein
MDQCAADARRNRMIRVPAFRASVKYFIGWVNPATPPFLPLRTNPLSHQKNNYATAAAAQRQLNRQSPARARAHLSIGQPLLALTQHDAGGHQVDNLQDARTQSCVA